MITVNSKRLRMSDLYVLSSYEGIKISELNQSKWIDDKDCAERDLALKIAEDGMTTKSQDIVVVPFHFTSCKTMTNESGDKKVVARKPSDIQKYFELDDEKKKKFNFTENEDIKSIITQYTPEKCKGIQDKTLNGVATIYSYSEIMNSNSKPKFNKFAINEYGELDKEGKIYRSIPIDMFSNIESMYENLGLEKDEDECGAICLMTNGSKDRVIQTIHLDGDGFYIVLFSTVEYTKNIKKSSDDSGTGLLPQIEALLFRDKDTSEEDFDKAVKTFMELSIRLFGLYSTRVLMNDFTEYFKVIPFDRVILEDLVKTDEKLFTEMSDLNVYSMTEKSKERVAEDETKKEKKSRKKKSKEDKAMEIVAKAQTDHLSKKDDADTDNIDLN